jgi:hypothetical protein
MMFCEIIRQVAFSVLPYHSELSLENAILHPIESHVNALGATMLDSAVGDASSRRIVLCDGSSTLGMAHFCEGGSKRTGFLGVVKEGSQFRFST